MSSKADKNLARIIELSEKNVKLEDDVRTLFFKLDALQKKLVEFERRLRAREEGKQTTLMTVDFGEEEY